MTTTVIVSAEASLRSDIQEKASPVTDFMEDDIPQVRIFMCYRLCGLLGNALHCVDKDGGR